MLSYLNEEKQKNQLSETNSREDGSVPFYTS